MRREERRQILVGSDGGVDDAIALAWLLQRDDVEVVAVMTVWGNVAVAQAARNLGVVLERFGHGYVPVHVGRPGRTNQRRTSASSSWAGPRHPGASRRCSSSSTPPRPRRSGATGHTVIPGLQNTLAG